MLVTASELSKYSQELNAVCANASSVAMDAYDAMRRADPNASIADIREGIIGIVESVLDSYGGAAGELAAGLYDSMASESGADVPEALLAEEDDAMAEAIERRARYIVGSLVTDREDI